MKLLFINLPYYGHFVPTVGLVQELMKRGCQVTYLMPHDWAEKVLESGADFHGYENHKKLSEQIKNAYRAAEKIIKEYDGVVYEQFFFLGKHLAEKYHKPVIRIFTAPATNEQLMQEYLNAGGPLGIFRCKWIARSWTKEILKALDIEADFQTDNWLKEIIHNPPALNMVYTLREFQPYEEEFPEGQYLFLGASVFERKEKGWSYKKEKRPLIYISLGTVVKGNLKFFRNCIDAFGEEDVEVILSTGKHFDNRKIKNIPKNIHIYAHVPQTEVLRQADVFVTHGGMNSISEAFTYAVPMVVIPFMSDQPVNARHVEELGVGIRLDYRKSDKYELRHKVLSLLGDKAIKEKMLKIQSKILNAPGNAAASETIIAYIRNQ